jgi:lipopolysaccharide/colanic/teichoic acid biosynthesis glycosyltransferase
VAFSPVIAIALLATWSLDRKNPIYVSPRAGLGGVPFGMLKIRTMRVHDGRGQITTAADDPRVTSLGRWLRRFKIDEFPQFLNIARGEMSFVGPRPQVLPEVVTYTEEEMRLLSVLPGLTDFASIVFSDLGEIVRSQADPHLAYQQLVRPWKSRLGLFYADHASLPLDFLIVLATVCCMFYREAALRLVVGALKWCGADNDLIEVAGRSVVLRPTPPPGAVRVIGS